MECSSEIADVLFMAKEKFNRTENRPSAQLLKLYNKNFSHDGAFLYIRILRAEQIL